MSSPATEHLRHVPDLGKELPPGARHYRAFVGQPERYDLRAAVQFNILTELGLREEHRVLDIGCGSLRAGRLLIPYLLPDCYCGVEPEQWLVEEGIRSELGQSIVSLKRPRFDFNRQFDFSVFSSSFDYAIAQSIFTHAAENQIHQCLRSVAAVLEPQGVLVATFVDGPISYIGSEWQYPHTISYPFEFFEQTAQKCGLACRRLPWPDPTGFSWMIFHKAEYAGWDNVSRDHSGTFREYLRLQEEVDRARHDLEHARREVEDARAYLQHALMRPYVSIGRRTYRFFKKLMGIVPKADDTPVLFVHAGTHKTASTYIQTFLSANREVLFSQGLYIPSAGQVTAVTGSGHHNLAFELNADPRFTPRYGSVSDLMRELESVKPMTACLSSEDFGYLCRNPEAVRRFVSQCAEINYTVKFVFFLRPQADYIESLYAELTNWGLSCSFDEVCRRFLADGAFCMRSRWWFCADYNLLLDPFGSVVGIDNLIVCPYRDSPTLDQAIVRFLSKVLPLARYDRNHYLILPIRENQAGCFSDVVRRFVDNNNSGTASVPVCPSKPASWDERDARHWQGAFQPVDSSWLLQLFKFARANLRVWLNYGAFVPVFSAKLLWRELKVSFGLSPDIKAKRRLLRNLCQMFVLPPSLDPNWQFG